MSVDFNSAELVEEILASESIPASARVALKSIGTQVRMHCLTSDRKTFTFEILNKDVPESRTYLTLRVIKGSFHTFLWSTFARFDDEYALYYHLQLEDLRDHLERVYLVWSIKGVDAVNAKISIGLIDWYLLRKIQAALKVVTVGVLAFSKLLGRFLLSVPNFVRTSKYIPPMPATFMFNYLMMVCYCPFELSISRLPALLSLPPDPNTGVTAKMLLQTFIQANGSGSWVQGYLPVRLRSGTCVLQSKYYVLPAEDAGQSGSGNGSGSGSSSGGGGAAGSCARSGGGHGVVDGPPQSTTHPAQSHSLSTTAPFERLLQDAAVRVVELMYHPLGVGGMIAVLEYVHNRRWAANTRYVVADVFKLCLAVRAAGQVPHLLLSQIPIYDQQAWTALTAAYQQHTNTITAPPIFTTTATTAGIDQGSSSSVCAGASGSGTGTGSAGGGELPSLYATVSKDENDPSHGGLAQQQQHYLSLLGDSSSSEEDAYYNAGKRGGEDARTGAGSRRDERWGTPRPDNNATGVTAGAGDDMEEESDLLHTDLVPATPFSQQAPHSQPQSPPTQRQHINEQQQSKPVEHVLQSPVAGAGIAAEGIASPLYQRRRAPSDVPVQSHHAQDPRLWQLYSQGQPFYAQQGLLSPPPGHRVGAVPPLTSIAADSQVDFGNSCEWGAPNRIRRPAEFYPMLIRELQQGPSGGAYL